MLMGAGTTMRSVTVNADGRFSIDNGEPGGTARRVVQ
jgi:hypothetical protein